MEQPTIAELLELIMMSESSIDTQFQSWLTITFATIVASFVARNVLTPKIRMITSSLYLVATFVLASRWYYDGQDIVVYIEMLATLDFTSPPPIAASLSRMLLMVLGTFATLYFVYEKNDT